MHPNSRRYFAAMRERIAPSATGAQEIYAKRLVQFCSSHRVEVGCDLGKALNNMRTKAEASAFISLLKERIEVYKQTKNHTQA